MESKSEGGAAKQVAIGDGAPSHFIRNIVAADVAAGKHGSRVHTRFPPEPNGYLHIGHAKSICLNFGLAAEFGGLTNLRFDDTNPSKEDVEYVGSIKHDVRWLGFDWDNREFYASDYFERLYGFAVKLIEADKAFVCDLTPEQMREYRGTLTEPGRNSPYRDRSVSENLDCSAACERVNFPMAAVRCARKSTWPPRTSGCATPCSIAFAMPNTITPATGGASIRCTILPIA